MKLDKFSQSPIGMTLGCIGCLMAFGVAAKSFGPAVAHGDIKAAAYLALTAFFMLPLPVILLLQFVSERGLPFPTTPLWTGLNYLGLLGRPFRVRYLELIGILGRIEAAREQMNYEKAESMALDALDSMATSLSDQTSLSLVPSLAMTTAILQCKMGKFDQALSLTEKYLVPAWNSYRLSKTDEAARHLGFNMNTLGCIFDDLNRPAESLNCYSTSIELKRLAGTKQDTAEANVGYANLCLGDFTAAERNLRETMRTLEAGPLTTGKLAASVRGNLGETLMELGKWDEAAPLVWASLHRKRELLHKNNPDLIRVTVTAARLLEHENKWHEAQEYFEQALSICANSVGEVHAETLVAVQHYRDFLLRTAGHNSDEMRLRYDSIRSKLSQVKIPESVAKLASSDCIASQTENLENSATTGSTTDLKSIPPDAKGNHPAVVALLNSKANPRYLYYGILALFIFRNGFSTLMAVLITALIASAAYKAFKTKQQIKTLSELIYSQESIPAKVNLMTAKLLGIFPSYKGTIIDTATEAFRNKKLNFLTPSASTRAIFTDNTIESQLVLNKNKRKIVLVSTPQGLVQPDYRLLPVGGSAVRILILLIAMPAILIGGSHLLGGVPPEKVPTGLTAQKYYDLGVDYKGVGWTEQSRESLKLAIKLDPDGVGKKAKLYLRTKLPHTAVSQDAVQMNIIGFNYQFADKKKAETAWKECIAKYPDFEWPYSNLASLYIEEDRLKEAEPLLEKALALNPDYLNALNNMADLKARLKDYTAVRKYAQQVIELDPDNLEATVRLKSLPDNQ